MTWYMVWSWDILCQNKISLHSMAAIRTPQQHMYMESIRGSIPGAETGDNG